MRLLIILILAVWVLITCVYSFQSANAHSLENAPIATAVEKGAVPCLVNLESELSACDSSNTGQARMVLIRGQVLPVEAK